ncbi:MAG: XdhC family protein [Flavobacteriaceae bacterium]|nr:XdhC family protein [Flavobacteriaceae bacterium]
MKTIYHQLVEKLQSGSDIQIGSLLATKGSAPQIPGAMALFDKDKVLLGTLGGGLLETHAQKAAALAFENQMNIIQLVNFDADIEDEVGAICGGRALFSIDSNPKQHLNVYLKLIDSLDRHKRGVLLTLFKKQDKQHLLIEKYWIEQNQSIPENIDTILNSNQLNFNKIIVKRKSCWIEATYNREKKPTNEISLFIEPINPSTQLIIVGAGHIGQALCKMAHLADFEVAVLDNRAELTNSKRFPEASQVICKPLNEGFKSLKITSEFYIVIATQGHRTDKEALRCCMQSDAAYIGVIGSKRKSVLMKKKFIEEAWASEEEWNFIHSPIGLDIHSKTVNEIAISITAQLIKKRYELNFLGKRKKVSCIVLAAGKSTRMGKQKLLLPYQKTSIIKSIVNKSLNSNSSQTIVVIGSHKKEVKEELTNCLVDLVENKSFEDGMLSSVQAGVSAVDQKTDGIIILLGDQPMVSEAIINRLITTFQKTNKGLIIPTFGNKRGHPVLISTKYKQQINELNPEVGLRELFLKNSQDILEIKVETDIILKDIDTPEDYKVESLYINN